MSPEDNLSAKLEIVLPTLEVQGRPAEPGGTGAIDNPAGAGHNRPPAVSQEMTALKKDLVSLKKQADKRHKPWYLDYSKTIPIFISVVTVAISIFSQQSQDVQKDLEALSETTGQIVDLRKEYTEKMMSGGDPALLQAESVLLNQKKLALQEKAKVMLVDPKVKARVSPDELRILANEFGYSGDVKEAERWLNFALTALATSSNRNENNTQNEFEKAYVMAGLAYWEMVNDRTPDALAEGRRRMQNAIDIFKKQGGEFSKTSLVQLYIAWSNQELVVGDIGRSRQQLQNANDTQQSMDPLDSDKSTMASLCLNMQHSIRSAQAHPSKSLGDPSDWYGNWSLRFNKSPQRTGLLSLNWNKQTNAVEARAEIFEGAKLVEQYAGTGGFSNAALLRIDWAQVFRITNPLAPPQPSLGYSMLSFESPQHLKISSYLLGDPPASATARKTN